MNQPRLCPEDRLPADRRTQAKRRARLTSALYAATGLFVWVSCLSCAEAPQPPRDVVDGAIVSDADAGTADRNDAYAATLRDADADADADSGEDGSGGVRVDADTDSSDPRDSGSGSAEVQFVNAVRVVSEDDPDALTFRLTLERRGDLGGAASVRVYSSAGTGSAGGTDLGPVSALIAGQTGANFQQIDAVVTFAGDETTATVEVPVIFDGLGRAAADFYVNLEAVAGCTLGNIAQQHWFVTGSVRRTGIWPDGTGSYGYKQAVSPTTGLRDIDIWDPPTDLTPFTGQMNVADGTPHITHMNIDAKGAAHVLRLWAHRTGGCVIENSVLHGATETGIYTHYSRDITVRNNWIYDIGLEGANSGRGAAYFVSAWKASAPDPEQEYVRNMKLLGCRINDTGSGMKGLAANVKAGEGGLHCINNYYTRPKQWAWGVDSHVTNNLFQWGTTLQRGDIRIEDNNVLLNGTADGCADAQSWGIEDVVNLYIGGLADDYLKIYDNWFVGHNYKTAECKYTSGLGILLADGDTSSQQYYHVTGNVISSTSNGGINAYRARDSLIEENFCYNGHPSYGYLEDAEPGENGVGLTGGDTGVVFRNNFARWYASALDGTPNVYRLSDYWKPENFDATNLRMTEWDDADVGDDFFRQSKQSANQPAIDDGIKFLAFSSGFPLGYADVAYDAAANTVTIATWGQTDGDPVTLAKPDYANQTVWKVYAADGVNWALFRLTVPLASLPATNKRYQVHVTKFRHKDRNMYPGSTGYWEADTAP